MKRDIEKGVDAIIDGYRTPELKARMDSLQERKNTLLAQLAVADEPPPLLPVPRSRSWPPRCGARTRAWKLRRCSAGSSNR